MVGNIEALRKDTEAIIAVNPVELVFTRTKKERDEYGNFKQTETQTAPQRVRLAELSHGESEKLEQQGLLKNHVINITAKHDADIQAGDECVFCGRKYKVEFIRKITFGGYEAENVYKMSGHLKEKSEAAE